MAKRRTGGLIWKGFETKRPKNKCKSCGYTWFPRGKNVSPQCPQCGHVGVSRVIRPELVAPVVVAGLVIFGALSPRTPPEKLAANSQIAAHTPIAVPEAPAQLPISHDSSALGTKASPISTTSAEHSPGEGADAAATAISANCEQMTVVERIVCGDAALKEAELRLSDLYAEALTRASDMEAISNRQQEWKHHVRDKCESAECLAAAIRQREIELSDQSDAEAAPP